MEQIPRGVLYTLLHIPTGNQIRQRAWEKRSSIVSTGLFGTEYVEIPTLAVALSGRCDRTTFSSKARVASSYLQSRTRSPHHNPEASFRRNKPAAKLSGYISIVGYIPWRAHEARADPVTFVHGSSSNDISQLASIQVAQKVPTRMILVSR